MGPLDTLTGMQGQPPDDYGDQPQEMEGQGFPEPGTEPDYPGATPVDYNINWDRERRDQFARYLCDEIDRWHEASAWRRANLKEWREAFELMPTAAPERWEGSATVPADFTRTACSAHHTRLNAQIVQSDPPFTAVAREPAAIEAAPRIEEALAARLDEAEWPLSADEVHSDLPISGNTFYKVWHEQVYKRVPVTEVEMDEKAFHALVVAGLDPLQAQLQALKKDAQGRDVVTLTHENVLVFDATKFKTIPFEDGVLFPPTVRDPLDAIGIGERVVITGAELMEGVKSKKFIEDEVDALMKLRSDPVPEDRAERLDQQGLSDNQSEGQLAHDDPRYRSYVCYDLWVKWDANDDGEDEPLLVTLHKDTLRILRVQYSPYEHGEPIYHLFRYGVRPGELLGFGVAETIACYQDAGNAVLNQLIDHGDLMLALGSTFIVGDEAGIDPNKFKLQMGVPIRAKDVRAIKELPLPKLPTEHYQLYQKLKDLVDFVSGSNNPSLGKTTDTERTLGEVQIVTSNANAIFEEIAARVARQWARVWDQVRYLEAQFGSGGFVKYRKTAAAGTLIQAEDGSVSPAPPEFQTVSTEMLLSDVDLVPAGLQQLSDVQSRTNQAMLVNQVLTTSPLTVGNAEVQLISLENLLRAVKFPMVEKVITAIRQQQMAQQAQQAMQQMAMAQMAQQGMLPPAGGEQPPGGPEGAGGAVPAPAGPPPQAGPAGAAAMPPLGSVA